MTEGGGWDDMMRYDGMEGWSFLFNFVQVVLFSFVCRDIGGKRLFSCAIDVMIPHDFLLF